MAQFLSAPLCFWKIYLYIFVIFFLAVIYPLDICKFPSSFTECLSINVLYLWVWYILMAKYPLSRMVGNRIVLHFFSLFWNTYAQGFQDFKNSVSHAHVELSYLRTIMRYWGWYPVLSTLCLCCTWTEDHSKQYLPSVCETVFTLNYQTCDIWC